MNKSAINRPFAVFDIDGTLLRWQFYHAIIHELGKNNLLSKNAHSKIVKARMAWKVRSNPDSFGQYEDVLITNYLKELPNITPTEHKNAEETIYKIYKNQTYTYTLNLIKELKQKNYLIFAISGSPQGIVDIMAKDLGFNGAIGAVLEQKDGKYTDKITTPIFDKALAVQKLISTYSLKLYDSIAIGDSKSDIAMLSSVERGIAFNPDSNLYNAALKNGWDIVIERKNVVYQLKADANKNYILHQDKGHNNAI
ncbi:HAD family phosphatase [Candidatus Saccharibacteria bacterium]|nr:HAD family phosphatase [Candidatus Saccharibacteria bacterium]MDQ5885179.1 hypothetical protein [Patescibacteria group bacterium]MDQ5953576.1 hypothetical protein [Patescibacteria group bacterium]MDQ5958624.1 hypothetical protein [Patescibacteria group bacterium]